MNSMQKIATEKTVVGRAVPVHFMDFDIADIPAKVDTGAYRSAVHVSNVKLSEDGKQLTFKLLGGHPVFKKLARGITVSDFNEVFITNSFGHREKRYEVKLKVKIAGNTFKTAFSLANREKMVFPILLGRKLLNRRFLVDSSQTDVDRLALKRQYDIDIPNEQEQKNEDSNSLKRPR